MNLIDRYVTEVGKHLPLVKGRKDIEKELRSTLEDMLEDRAQKAGRASDETMEIELLKEYGSPQKVATTYNPQPYLIGPRMYPIFLMVLKIVTTVAALKSLGAAYRFPTEVFVDSPPSENDQRMDPSVGFDEKRGDSISVSSMPFYQSPPDKEAAEPGLLQSPTVQSFGKQGLAAALFLVVALLLIRPLLKAMGGAGGAPALSGAGGGGGGGLPAEQRGPLSYDDKVSVARQLADKNPERVAQIVRSWVQADG